MRILRTWKCDLVKEIEKLKQQLSNLDGLSEHRKTVLTIIGNVRKQGDKAIINYSKRFDRVLLSADELRVKDDEIEHAYGKISIAFVNPFNARSQTYGRIRSIYGCAARAP